MRRHGVRSAIEKLNGLRNRLAHNLERVGVRDEMSDFTQHVLREKQAADPKTEFYVAAFKVCHAAVSNLRDRVDWTDFDDAF
jgi:hypothetical protein